MRLYWFMLPALALMGCDGKDTDTGSSGDADGDGFTVDVDCDDGDASVNPGADELCDDLDNNCNDEIDEDPADGTLYYSDGDGDGYGDADVSAAFCTAPASGYVDNSDDCDDGYALSLPGGTELCDGADNDCDGTIDNGTDDIQTFYADSDTDGYGDPDTTIEACAAPSGYVSDWKDCDDTNAALNPTTVWYPDGDGDGYGDDAGTLYVGCEAPVRYTVDGGDCNDADSGAYPGATEVCNGADDDCDGALPTDEEDVDLDGSFTCEGDCDDGDSAIYVGAEEVCDDGIDNNCSGAVDEQCPTVLGSSTTDVQVTGQSTYDYFAQGLASGDIDGDGDDDLIIGSYGSDLTSGTSYAGQVFIFEGPMSSGTSLSYSDADVTISGTTSSDYFGFRVESDMDLDGDGYDDIIATAYGNDDNGSSSGASYVFYGPVTDMTASGSDAVIYGINSSDYLGYLPFETGDYDGDGDDDVVTTAYYWDLGTSYSLGRIGIFSEPEGEYTQSEADVSIIGITSYSYVGYSLELGGDANGDGTDDLVWGDNGEDKAFIVYGPVTAGALSYTDADAAMYGNQTYGAGMLESGDMNGDGYDDFMYGSEYISTGASYGGALFIVNGPITSDVAVETSYDSMIYGNEAYIYMGDSYYGDVVTEDMDGDGFDDVMVGSSYVDYNGLYSTGGAFMFNGPVSGQVSLGDFDRGYYGAGSYDYTGRGINTGDLDDDGNPDFLIGSAGANSYVGAAYVIFNGSL
jgi:hypothetical protein